MMLPDNISLKNDFFEELLESTSDVVIISDYRGEIIRTNQRAAQLFLDDSILGKPFWEILKLECSNLTSAINQLSDTTYLPGAPERCFLSESTGMVYDIQLVTLGKRKKSAKGFLLILNNISALTIYRTEMERQFKERTLFLDRSQKLLQTVFQGVGKGIVLLDEDMEVIESNQKACEIFGLHPSNILGVDIFTLCHESHKNSLEKILHSIIENQVLSTELSGLYFDKSIFPAVFTVSTISCNEKKLWIIIAEDISEQKRLEQQLINEKLLIDEANITLRNVLKSIQSEQLEQINKISNVIVNEIFPALNKIKSSITNDIHKNYVDFVVELLVSLTKGTEAELDPGLIRLSKTEVKICKFIQAGFSSKEICSTMNLAFDTIQTHRKNIRKKLGLSGSGDTSLYGFLASRKLS